MFDRPSSPSILWQHITETEADRRRLAGRTRRIGSPSRTRGTGSRGGNVGGARRRRRRRRSGVRRGPGARGRARRRCRGSAGRRTKGQASRCCRCCTLLPPLSRPSLLLLPVPVQLVVFCDPQRASFSLVAAGPTTTPSRFVLHSRA